MGTLTNQYDTTWFPLTCLADVLVNMYMKMVGIQSAIKSPEKIIITCIHYLIITLHVRT